MENEWGKFTQKKEEVEKKTGFSSTVFPLVFFLSAFLSLQLRILLALSPSLQLQIPEAPRRLLL